MRASPAKPGRLMPTTARLAWCTAKRRPLPQGANVPYRREVGRRGADPPTCRTGKYGRRTHSLPTRQSTANIRRYAQFEPLGHTLFVTVRHSGNGARSNRTTDWPMVVAADRLRARAPGRRSGGGRRRVMAEWGDCGQHTHATQVRELAKINTPVTRTRRHSPAHGGTIARIGMQAQ